MQNDSIQGVIFTSKRDIKFKNVPSTHEKVFWFIKNPREYIRYTHKHIDQSREYVPRYSTLAPKKHTGTTAPVDPKNLVLR